MNVMDLGGPPDGISPKRALFQEEVKKGLRFLGANEPEIQKVSYSDLGVWAATMAAETVSRELADTFEVSKEEILRLIALDDAVAETLEGEECSQAFACQRRAAQALLLVKKVLHYTGRRTKEDSFWDETDESDKTLLLLEVKAGAKVLLWETMLN